MNRPTHLKLTFSDSDVTAIARPDWDLAPNTCKAVTEILPASGVAHQAIYSGSETVFVLPKVIQVAPENATSNVTKGDVGFTWMKAGSSYGVTSDFAEICWFYDIDAEPRMWEGPCPVNIFAQIEPDGADAFYDVCRRIRREGVKSIRVDKK